VELYREQRSLGGGGRWQQIAKFLSVIGEVLSSRSHGSELGSVQIAGKMELPPAHLVPNQVLARVLDFPTARGEHPTVVDTACPRPMFVDRALVLDQLLPA